MQSEHILRNNWGWGRQLFHGKKGRDTEQWQPVKRHTYLAGDVLGCRILQSELRHAGSHIQTTVGFRSELLPS